MALLAHRHRDWGCLLVYDPNFKHRLEMWGVPARLLSQPFSENTNVGR